MILAYPTDKEGKPIGGERSFPDDQWARMKRIPNLRWKELPNLKAELDALTKREIIEKYGLPGEDIKLKKSEIINKVL